MDARTLNKIPLAFINQVGVSVRVTLQGLHNNIPVSSTI